MTAEVTPLPSPAFRSTAVGVAGIAVVGGALLLSLLTPAMSAQQWAVAGILLVANAVAAGTTLDFRWFSRTPTKAAVVASLCLLPAPLVPLVVLIGQAVAVVLRYRSNVVHMLVVRTVLTAPVLTVVLTLTLFGASDGQVPVGVLGVVLVQLFVLETLLRWLGDRRSLPTGRRLFLVLVQSFGVDLLLIGTGLAAVVAAQVHWTCLGFLIAPLVLVSVLTQEQRGLGQQVVRARSEARLDPLTGLGNRRAWLEGIQHAVEDRPDRESPIGIVMADLDNLKLANDNWGHQVGDQLIAAVGSACEQVAPTGSVVCRIGGDEFAVMIPDAVGDRAAAAVAQSLRSSLASRPAVRGLRVSAGIGHAASPPAASVGEAIDLADAMVLAEKRGTHPKLPSQFRRALRTEFVGDTEPTVRILPHLRRHSYAGAAPRATGARATGPRATEDSRS